MTKHVSINARPRAARGCARSRAIGAGCAAFRVLALSALLALPGIAYPPGALAQTMPFAPIVDPASLPNPNRDAIDISALLRAGRTDAANAKVDALLAKNPRDAQARFLKGLVLTDQGKTAEAIAMFRALTVDYPELPEPYNNLASLYAAGGQLEQARVALESAIAANPSYAVAWDNLGDLYARLASQAYDRSLQINRANPATQAKATALRNAIPAPPAAKLPGR